jgi:hypothetical protein
MADNVPYYGDNRNILHQVKSSEKLDRPPRSVTFRAASKAQGKQAKKTVWGGL